jgi:hypothetical protein
MRICAGRLVVSLLLCSAPASWAQTADEIVERTLTALGGRSALEKVTSRLTVGTITLSTPAGDITGSVESLNAVPNKSRTVIKADLSAFGAGPLIVDQRFNGSSGYILDTLQGDREMTGTQLANLRNNAFPHLFLKYKELGTAAQATGKQKVGDREAYVLTFEPKNGPASRQYIDAETYLPLKALARVDVPQLGRELEQTIEFSDYREVDGIQIPFRLRSSSEIQSYTIEVTAVEHNVTVDDALFSKPQMW